MARVLLLLSAAFLSAVGGQKSADDDCTWESESAKLSCNLKTLQSNPTLISQVENSKSVNIHCAEEFLYESVVRVDQFGTSPNLEDLSIRHCKIKTLPDGAFVGLNSLKSLTIQGYNSAWSSSLKLEVAPGSLRNLNSLINLDLSHNNLWGLPGDLLCPCGGLEVLNLTRNNIVEVSEVGLGERSGRANKNGCQLYQLRVLDLSYNKISSFQPYDLLYAPNIKELRLRGNKLSVLADAALTGLPALVTLDLAENKLAAIPPKMFNPVSALERLFLEKNSLTILTADTFSPLDNLLQLNLSTNQLTSNIMAEQVFHSLTKLVALDLSHNEITSIPDSMFVQQVVLQILNLSHNKISSLAAGSLQALANLHILFLSYNSLSTLPPTLLHSLPSLKSLSLDHNQLVRLPDQLFKASPHLQDLSLNHNWLEQIPGDLDKLVSIRTLDLGENNIASFTTRRSPTGDGVGGGATTAVFHKLTALYGLRLAGNRLTEIPDQIFRENRNLHVLNLAHNQISNISRRAFAELDNLRALRLDNNNLSNINGLVGQLKNLKWLNVSENSLQWFDFAFIPKSLEWLDVHNNRIDTIGNYYNLADGFSLKTFDASYNRIEAVTNDSLLHSLQSIYLNNNAIKSVAAGSFRQLEQLHRVELQDNQLSHLELAAVELSYSGESPEFLVGGNPWVCDCELEWLKNVNQLTGTGSYPRILDLDTIMCGRDILLHNTNTNLNRISPSFDNDLSAVADVADLATTASVPLLHMRADQFVCEYDAHCIPQCYCCDFFACDCRMQCPEGCSCYHDNSWTNNVIQCSNRGHMDVPPLIPMDATAVYLDGNNMSQLENPGFIGRRRVRAVYLNNSAIVRITNYSFEGLIEVKTLHLEDNQIKLLAGNEFSGLTKLQELYLHNNFITNIAPETFSNLRDLAVLRLDGNLLTSFPVWQLGNNPGLKQLRLAPNMWTCECAFVRPFLKYRARMGSRILDADRDVAKCVTTSGRAGHHVGGEVLAVMSDTGCSEEGGGSGDDTGVAKDFQSGNKAGGIDYTPILVSVLLVVLIIVVGYLLAFTFRKTIKSWFFGSKATSSGGGADNNASVYNNEKLFDVFISYALDDADIVEGNIAQTLEHGATSYRLCLHQRDFPPTTPLPDTVSVAVETSTRAVIVLSRAYLATQWVNIRPSFMKAIKDNNTKVVFILLEEVDMSGTQELRQLREDSPVVHWHDPGFWNKLRYFLPEPVYLTFHRNVTMRGTLQQTSNLYQPVLHPYPRLELLASGKLAPVVGLPPTSPSASGTDHSTDTTTVTAASAGSVYATAGSEHTYHSIDNNHIYHTLDPGPANMFHLHFAQQQHPAAINASTVLTATGGVVTTVGGGNERVVPGNSLELMPTAGSNGILHNLHPHDMTVHSRNGRTMTALAPLGPGSVRSTGLGGGNNGLPPSSQHSSSSGGGGGNHTPSNSTCSAKRLLSGEDGEYIV